MATCDNPTFSEIKDATWEWASISVDSVAFGDSADCYLGKGDITQPFFHLKSTGFSSEYGAYEFEKALINIQETSRKDLEQLNGEHPLGYANIVVYDDEIFINLPLDKVLIDRLQNFLSNDNHKKLVVRIGLPTSASLGDRHVCVVPIMKYIVIFDSAEESFDTTTENYLSRQATVNDLQIILDAIIEKIQSYKQYPIWPIAFAALILGFLLGKQ